jgi:aldehyde:ferredoxin oxidoreductase
VPHSNKSYGWTGKILLIDLCTQKYEVIRPEENIYKSFLGGRGLCSYYMREIKNLMPSEIPLLFFPGALTGTKIPFAVKKLYRQYLHLQRLSLHLQWRLLGMH